ncbi:hypothetical protein [Candidatus Accumulibacter vicinus]|uniref:Uncharacterized protein n=1 Tax=Candidatus Accumulibacter vicinus TaxID=2954382 RepID=A0A084XUG9_9PROT|nr:hypothetical protein [Candidatus Accumulibacter vicinus]KFB66113.1 MAG: hypothetical protein CAPSK01_004608 [Candidatus Accumulibacter vicinus]
MRYFMVLVFGLLLGSPHVHACRNSGSWNRLFFEAIPNPQPDADLIAIISVSDKQEPRGGATVMATATIIQVLKTSDARVKQGEKLSMQLENSSCGPDPLIGSKGTIIAKVATDSKGRLVLHPYMHRKHDGRIVPPAMLPDGFNLSPRSLSVGEGIPENFAVILIGVTGAESVDFLDFDHSAQPSMSASFMDARFPAPSNTIIAIGIPVGIKQLSIHQITSGRRRSGFRPNDTVGVNTPKLDVDRPGLYYVATLDTDNPGRFQIAPIPEQLIQFRATYVDMAQNLAPINFKWPAQ